MAKQKRQLHSAVAGIPGDDALYILDRLMKQKKITAEDIHAIREQSLKSKQGRNSDNTKPAQIAGGNPLGNERRPNEFVFGLRVGRKDTPNDFEAAVDSFFENTEEFEIVMIIVRHFQFLHVGFEGLEGATETVVEMNDFDECTVAEKLFALF